MLSPIDLSLLFPVFVKPCVRFDTWCSHLVHCCHRKPGLIGSFGISGDLAQRRVAGDRCDLVLSASRLGQSSRCSFAQPMSRAVRKPGIVALISEPIAETGSGKRSAELRRQERQMLRRRGVDDRLQVSMHRDRQRRTGLDLADVDRAIPVDVLLAHRHHVRPTLPGIEQ